MGSEDFYATIGVHPCRAREALEGVNDSPDANLADYFEKIRKTLLHGKNKEKYVAIGECGLDYDRLEYADKETQLKVFPKHFELSEEFGLPMYFHSRSTNGDFLRIIKENRDRFTTGVVHSFDGTSDDL